MKESLGVLEFLTSFSCTSDFQLKLYPNPGNCRLSCCFAGKPSMQAVLERSLPFLSVDFIPRIFETRYLPYGKINGLSKLTCLYPIQPPIPHQNFGPAVVPYLKMSTQETNSQYNVQPVGKRERFDVVPLGRWKAYESYESNKVS